ncbi:MAG: filamentous hemagglutinin N-terminal domain-containing protein [Pleurocapsa sp. MO_226.B13]|nr:filamentous hemagglutinin N-terminal domain-containing protein [Pleurocapsa sp. MO_226.B13]
MKQNFTAPLSLVCLFGVLLEFNPASAQVTPDGTTSTTVNVEGNNFEINNGDRTGNNLFHSFRDFSVPTGGEAFFNNALDISNILSRVTGGNISSIDGLIRANGSANLFLINPAGIIFGQNARLDIGGSFLGSTADSILFSEGEFSAVDLDNPPLLTINAPIGLGIRDEPGDIAITGDNANQTSAFLEVNPGQNLTLVGGDINFDTGIIFAPAGNVELGGLSAAGVVEINEKGSLGFPDGIERADISFTSSSIFVANNGGGFININARDLDLTEGSRFSAGIEENMGSVNAQAGDITINATDTVSLDRGAILNDMLVGSEGQGGDIDITTDSLFMSNGSLIGGITFGKGDLGNIKINATDTVSLDESEISNIVDFLVEGQGGDIEITADSLVLTNRALEQNTSSRIRANTSGQGDAGDVKINVGQLLVRDGSNISTSTFPDAEGQGGNLFVTASDSVELIGSSVEEPPTSLLAQTAGVANGGNLTVDTRKLIIRDGAGISTQAFGEGRGGNLAVTASESVELIGISPTSILPSGLFTLTSKRFTENPVGDGGDITIATGKLIVRDGAFVDASTTAEGQGGDVTITASESVEVIGPTSLLSTDSDSLSSNAEGAADFGNAGTLKIETEQLILRDRAQISTATFTNGNGGIIDITTKDLSLASEAEIDVSTSGQGNAGTIQIDATSVAINGGSEIRSETRGRGNAGQIMINGTDSISLDGIGSDGFGSGIFARVFEGSEGRGGNVNITTTNLSLADGTQIVTDTRGNGNAGNITIDTTNIFLDGIESEVRSAVQSTGRGNAGNVNITTDSLSLANEAEVNTSTLGRGDAGTVEINSTFVAVNSGSEIRSETTGQGNGGNIIINASDRVSVDGVGSDGFGSGIFARSFREAEGSGGNINITTDSLSVTNQAEVNVSSSARGSGGNIEVEANSIELDRGTLQAATAFGQGGNIQLQIDDNLTLRNNSTISARAFEAANGGNINIDAKFIIAFPSQNNDILASASEEGMGGRITLDAESVFGIQERPQSDRTNDIDASGGVDGEVIINTPNIDITQGLVKAPQNVVEPEQTTAQACQRDRLAGRSGGLIVKGKGGIPPEPIEPIDSDAIIVDGQFTNPNSQVQSLTIKPVKTSRGDIYPARGIIKTEDGQVILTAYSTDGIDPRTPYIPVNCARS